MASAVAQGGAGSAAKDVKRESGTARLLGSGMSFFSPLANKDSILMELFRVCRYRRVDGFPSRTRMNLSPEVQDLSD
jgi:hypothetical protein